MTILLKENIDKIVFIFCLVLRTTTFQVPQVLICHQRTLQETRSRSKIWSPYEFRSNHVSRNLRNLWNPFQDTFGNRKPPYFAESNRVTPFHAIKENLNQLFRQNNRLFSKKLGKGFETDMFLLFGLNSSPDFPKPQFCEAIIVLKLIGLWKTCPQFLKNS